MHYIYARFGFAKLVEVTTSTINTLVKHFLVNFPWKKYLIYDSVFDNGIMQCPLPLQVELKEMELAHQEAVKALKLVWQCAIYSIRSA